MLVFTTLVRGQRNFFLLVTLRKMGGKDVGYDVQMTCESWFCVVPSGVSGLAR